MMEILNWMGEHPTLSVILVFIIVAGIHDTVAGIVQGIAYCVKISQEGKNERS